MPKKPKRPILYVIGPSIAYVQLTRGYFSLIDAEDGERVGKHTWYVMLNKGKFGTYASAAINTREVGLHRFLTESDKPIIDHKNRNTLDNRKVNLRPATRSENRGNTGPCSHNTSGYTGVYWSRTAKAWVAQIGTNKKVTVLGNFDTPEEASEAYREAAQKKWGEFLGPVSVHEQIEGAA